jgi:hypothetical protein
MDRSYPGTIVSQWLALPPSQLNHFEPQSYGKTKQSPQLSFRMFLVLDVEDYMDLLSLATRFRRACRPLIRSCCGGVTSI